MLKHNNQLSELRSDVLESVGELRAVAGAWDRLWQQSDVTMPTACAEPVADWMETFAPGGRFRALVVWQGDRLVGALPLVERRRGGCLPVADLSNNHWSSHGELLLDRSADLGTAVVDRLARAACEQPWPLLWLTTVPCHSDRWAEFCEALARLGARVDIQPHYEIGCVSVDQSFEAYLSGRSRNLRRSIRKDSRRLASGGEVVIEVHDHLAAGDVEKRLRRAFSLEDLGWKGAGGTSVFCKSGMFDFYLRQARRFAPEGRFRLAFLRQNARPIAFEMGWLAKGVYHSLKVGYDERYRKYGPGHLLRAGIVETDCGDPAQTMIDFHGPMTEALRPWATESYTIGRIAVCPPALVSRALWTGIRGIKAVSRSVSRVASWLG